MRYLAALGALVLLAGCEPRQKPPAALSFDGVPVQGSLADATRAGFLNCGAMDADSMRCRRTGVYLEGQGPYSAAVDLRYSDGSGGFDLVTLWSDTDQMAVHAVGDALKAKGWSVCRNGQEDRGDQEIYTKAGSPVRISIDLSYWSKRRLRVLSELGQPTGKCW